MSKPTDDELRALASAMLATGRHDDVTGLEQTDDAALIAHLGWSPRKVQRVARELARAVPSTWVEPPRWQFWRRRRP